MKYALVTGATSGLGREVAVALSKKGWYVFACGRNEDALEDIKKNTDCQSIKMDVVDQKSIDEAYKEVVKVTDYLDAIINFSGIQKMSSLIEGDIDIIKQTLEVTLLGMARVNKTFFPLVEKWNGRIINCSSECGWMTPQPFNGTYTLSKYAVEAYNDSLRRELMFVGVPVIKIQPGSFKTAMHKKTADSFDRLINSTHMYREVLEKMKGMMLIELKMANKPDALIRAVLKAANAPHPRKKYRVKNSPILSVIEIMPPTVVDALYKKFLKSEKVGRLLDKIYT